MLKNIFLEIEYDGTNYFGWQIQNRPQGTQEGTSELRTVQGELEKALEKLFREKIRVSYGGRTDKGVHARGQCVNFKVDTKIPLNNIKEALNSLLPDDVIVKRVEEVPLQFHSRFSVKSKVYRYVILNSEKGSVFYRNYTWFIRGKIDLEKIERIIPHLIGKKDVSVFAKDAKKYKSCVREIKSISVRKKEAPFMWIEEFPPQNSATTSIFSEKYVPPQFIFIDIEAEGFLRNMARNLVAFLIKVGRGEIELDVAEKIIYRKIPYVNKPAPPNGLYLLKINY